MKERQAILVVSFGTVEDAARRKSIGALELAVEKAFPDFSVRRAFTSEAVIRRLAGRGIGADNVERALEALLNAGFCCVHMLPTHLMHGGEYRKLLEQEEAWREKFTCLTVARPLLWEEKDLAELADVLLRAHPCRQGEALLLMGHGSDAGGNKVFPALERSMKDRSGHSFVAVMQGKPELPDVLDRIRSTGYPAVRLVPLMLTAGSHVRAHMLGDRESSWKSRCLAAGLDVTCVPVGLGELPEVREIYLRHLRESMDAYA